MQDCTPAHEIYDTKIPGLDCLPHTGSDIWPLVGVAI